MASKKDKKLEHIQVKDNGIKLSQTVGDQLNDLKATLERGIIRNLIKNSNETNMLRYRIAQNNLLREFRFETDKLIKHTAKNIKASLKNDKTVNLTNKQVVEMSSQINKGLLFLEKSAIASYQSVLKEVVLKCKSAGDLKDHLQKHINTGLNIGVVYKDGKHFQFDTYFEMKARTDIQQDIGKNMVDAGNALGNIFYITSFYGDCAKDHAAYQGKIYVDKDWEANAPKDRLDEIRNYISSHNIMTVQEVMGAPVYLTTRPNCRHYFQYIDIDSVLGAKDKQAVRDLRTRRNLNFNGRYKQNKYKALQQQRLNERKIRAVKSEVEKQEQLLALNPGNKEIQSRIMNGEQRIRDIQADQRELIKNNSNLERRYDREKPGNRVSLGTSK